MSESFDIAVRIDPSNAAAGVAKVEATLSHLEGKAKTTAANTQKALNTIGLPDAPKSSGGMGALGGFLGLAAGPAIAGTILGIGHQIEDLVHEHEKLADEYTNLANHALKFADKNKSVNQVIGEQVRLAGELRSTLGQTMGLYDAVGDATDELGLSQRELIALTRTLGEGATLAGKSIDSAGGIMGRLSIAMTSGADAGKQLKAILRDFPELGDALAAAWHTDTKGVIEFASTGVKSLTDITDVWISSSESIHKSALARKRTYEEERKAFQDAIVVGVGQGLTEFTATVEAAGIPVTKFGDVVQGLGMKAKPVSDVIAEFTQRIRDQITEMERLAGQKSAKQAQQGILGLSEGLGDLIDAGKTYASTALNMAGVTDTWRVETEDQTKSIRDQSGALNELTAAERLLLDAQRRRWDEAEAQRAREQQVEKNGVTGGALVTTPIDLTAGMKGGPDRGDGVAGQGPGAELSDYAMDTSVTTSAAAEAHKQIVLDAEQSAEATRRAWEQGIASIGVNFIRLAADGEASFGQMTEAMIGDISKLILKMAALEMIKAGGGVGVAGGILSGLLGGAHGFDHIVGAGNQLPGFAHGGSMTATGGGGVDQQLAMFRVSSGESIHVRTPQQREAERMAAISGARQSAIPTRVTNQIVVQSDPREVTRAMGSYSGQREHVALNRKFGRRR